MNGPATLFTRVCDSPAAAPLLSPSPSLRHEDGMRRGEMRWGAFGIPGHSLLSEVDFLRYRCGSTVHICIQHRLPRRDMYRLAKLFSNGRLCLARFGLSEEEESKSRRRGKGNSLFFSPLPLSSLYLSRTRSLTQPVFVLSLYNSRGIVCEIRFIEKRSTDKSMYRNSKRKWHVNEIPSVINKCLHFREWSKVFIIMYVWCSTHINNLIVNNLYMRL